MSSSEKIFEKMIEKVHTLKVRIRAEKKSEETDDTELLIDITDIQKKILGYILRNIAHS